SQARQLGKDTYLQAKAGGILRVGTPSRLVATRGKCDPSTWIRPKRWNSFCQGPSDERSWRSPVLLPTLRLPNRQLLLIQASSLEDRAAELRWGLPVHLAKDEKLSLEVFINLAQDTAASVLRAVLRQLRPLAAHLGSSKSVEEELCVPGTFVSPDLPGFLCMAKASSASSASSALFAVAAALHCEDSWEFLELVLAKCMLATQEEVQACARLQRRELGLGGCFPLVERLPLRGEGLALRVGGWAYGGSLEADGVFNAVCSVLRLSDEKPPQCSDLWHWSGPGFYAQNVPLWPHSCAVLLLSFFIPIFWPLLWRCPCRACRCRGGLVGPAKMPRSLVTG
ncbi:unnamed protein product, partial [Durusdinium trenchii]